ncbi:MAG: hypothetical protein PIR53_16055 [Nocardioides alkalitolerans]
MSEVVFPGEAGSSKDLSTDTIGTAYACRQGLLLLQVPTGKLGSGASWLSGVCDALKADSRVSDLKRPRHREHQARVDVMYPRNADYFDDDLLTGRDRFFAYRMSDPVTFVVQVAAEDQTEFRGSRDFPDGPYYVSWDGICLAVLWEQPSDQMVSIAAGRFVADVIRDAATSSGLDVFVQACSPGCQNIFTHVDTLIVSRGTYHRNSDRVTCTHRDKLGSPFSELDRWFGEISYPFFLFGTFKNHSRRIRDLDKAAGFRLSALLQIQQKRGVISAESGVPKKIRERWKMRGWRKAAESLTADVWLASAVVETMRREWNEERRRFREYREKDAFTKLFSMDSSDDELAVESIDMSLARQALTHTSSRLDTRMMVFVTALAGCAGLIGAVSGGVLGATIAG